jgi:hypothetical protein
MNQDLRIIVKETKTGLEIKHLLNHVPRVGDAIVSDKKKLYRVNDCVWISQWSKYHPTEIYHEACLYVTKERRK